METFEHENILSRQCTAKLLLVSECIFVLPTSVLVFSNLFIGLTWLPFFMNFLFLLLQVSAIVFLIVGMRRNSTLCTLPMICYETVSIFWILVWLYACFTSVFTGFLWPVEWLGGPQSSRDTVSRNILDPHYADPSETNPETQKAISLSGTIMGVLMLVFFYKLFLWTIAKECFVKLQDKIVDKWEKAEEELEDELSIGKKEEETEPIPIVYRQNPRRSLKQSSPKIDEIHYDFSASSIEKRDSVHSLHNTNRHSRMFESEI